MKNGFIVLLLLTVSGTSIYASQASTPRRTFSNTLTRLLLGNLGYDEQQSDEAKTELAESPSHEGQDPLGEITEYCNDLDNRVTSLEKQLQNPSFMSLKTPHAAAFFTLLAHASWLDAVIRNSSLSDKKKDILEQTLQKSRENLKLNCAQTILMQRHAHNGWHYMAWCSVLDALHSKVELDVQPVAIYFGNRFSEETIKMAIKGIGAWCLASLAQKAFNARHHQ